MTLRLGGEPNRGEKTVTRIERRQVTKIVHRAEIKTRSDHVACCAVFGRVVLAQKAMGTRRVAMEGSVNRLLSMICKEEGRGGDVHGYRSHYYVVGDEGSMKAT